MPTFPKAVRLRKRSEYLLLVDAARRYTTSAFLIVYADNNLEFPRLGITVSRRVGNAVCRNRIKRLVREFFRTNRDLFRAADFNIIARSRAGQLEYAAVHQELANALARIGRNNCS
jgi:ribonuclease P protein component